MALTLTVDILHMGKPISLQGAANQKKTKHNIGEINILNWSKTALEESKKENTQVEVNTVGVL